MQFKCFLDKDIREKNEKMQREIWHSWFAWRPVRVGDTRAVWFETVLRKGIYSQSGYFHVWEYQAREKEGK